MGDDIFEDVLNLEDRYFREGYQLGVEDGSRAGRVEGRTFGLEKGFDKFFEMGKLHGRSQLLIARLPTEPRPDDGDQEKRNGVTRPLASNERLAKHIHALFALTELASLSTENSEDAVSEFDDRFKRAKAKAKVVENIVGEGTIDDSEHCSAKKDEAKASGVMNGAERQMEDFGVRKAGAG